METSTTSVVSSAGTGEEDDLRAHPPKLSCVNSIMRCNPFRGGRQITASESDPRPEIELPLLRRRCQVFDRAWVDAPRRYADERQRMEGEIKLILQTLGVDLLEHIMTTFYNTYREHRFPEATRTVSSVKYDRQLDTPSMVEDIKTLQVKSEATNDGGEQRALEEDITGKVRIVSSYSFSTLGMVLSLIDPVALVVWDLCRSRRTITQGRKLHSKRRNYGWFTDRLRG
ncbi:hypothetical protein EDD17DRAFT_85928 [Pisolithus thermaeus]|nr:hypothetical protein EDD17DRAFT_85928 [Pisolithus thermaeus]